jgi:hypothetical protein
MSRSQSPGETLGPRQSAGNSSLAKLSVPQPGESGPTYMAELWHLIVEIFLPSEIVV